MYNTYIHILVLSKTRTLSELRTRCTHKDYNSICWVPCSNSLLCTRTLHVEHALEWTWKQFPHNFFTIPSPPPDHFFDMSPPFPYNVLAIPSPFALVRFLQISLSCPCPRHSIAICSGTFSSIFPYHVLTISSPFLANFLTMSLPSLWHPLTIYLVWLS